MNKSIIKFFSAFVLALLLSFAYLFTPQIFLSLDNRLRDFMFVSRGELPKNDNIIIIDIDEKSLKEYGQWPWSRDLVATLLYELSLYNPGIIGLDIVFAEEDHSSPHKIGKKFLIEKQLPNNDKLLADVFNSSPIVGGYIFTFNKQGEKKAPNIPAVIVQKGLRDNHSILSPHSVILNIPLLQDALYSSGFFNNLPDSNGMIRTVPLIMKYDYNIYTSLPLEMVRIYSNENKIILEGDTYGTDKITFGNYTIPVDSFGRLYVNFRGPSGHYKYISASDILNHTIEDNILENKFVLVGTSALGLYDLRAIAYDSNIPGVEIHANVIDNLLKGDFLTQPTDHNLYNLIIIWILIFTLMYILSKIRSWLVLPFGFILFYGVSYLFYIILFQYGLVLNLLFPLLASILTLILVITIDYTIAHKQKEEAKKILGKKVSTSVMNHLIKHSKEDLVSPKEVEATIFFSDIQGFTSISEKLESPDRLIKMLNTYMTPMVESIINHQGTIDKFIGDAIMAYWNAPLAVKNHADMALKCAIDQIDNLEKINKEINKTYDITLNIGIGLHTGLVTAGDMGAEGRSDYTIIGDNVNLASRMEGLTRYYDIQILISQACYNLLTEEYNIRPIDIVEVKGKSKPVEIYEVIPDTKFIDEKESKLYTSAITNYRKGNISQAKTYFTTLLNLSNSLLYRQYLNRCNYFLENPDEIFSPILKMDTK